MTVPPFITTSSNATHFIVTVSGAAVTDAGLYTVRIRFSDSGNAATFVEDTFAL